MELSEVSVYIQDKDMIGYNKSLNGDAGADKKESTNYYKADVEADRTLSESDPSTLKQRLKKLYGRKKKQIFTGLKMTLALFFLVYVGYSFSVRFGDEGSVRLLVCTAFGLLLISWRYVKKTKPELVAFGKYFTACKGQRVRRVIRWFLYIVVGAAAVTITVIFSVKDNLDNLISLGGLAVFIILMYITSTNRAKVQWHTVYWGFLVQLILGIIFVRTDVGESVMSYIRDRFTEFTMYSEKGAEFAFGSRYKEFQFIFQSMPRVLFFVTMINVLQYLGVVAFVVECAGGFLAFCLGTRPVESVVAASNVILGSNEAFFMVKPYLNDISSSELFCLLVCGMASTAGSAMIVFQGFGVPMEHLLTASVLSAPAALVCAKLNMPEEDDDDDDNKDEKKDKEKKDEHHEKKEREKKEEHHEKENEKTEEHHEKEREKTEEHHEKEREKTEEHHMHVHVQDKEMAHARNVLEALTQGAQQGTVIVSSIVVTMIIYLSLTDFINATLEWFGDRKISSYVLWPLPFLMGVPSTDCLVVARLLGIRGLTNAGIAYIQMGQFLRNKEQLVEYEHLFNDTVHMANRDIFLPRWNTTLVEGVLQPRTEIIGTYALCGFSCIPILGMTLGVFASIAPKRIREITNVIIRAFLISSIASFCTACIAGLLYTGT